MRPARSALALLVSGGLGCSSPSGESDPALDVFAAGARVVRFAPSGDVSTSSAVGASVSDLAVSPDGATLAVAAADGITWFRSDTLAPVDSARIGIVDGIEWSPDGTEVLALVHPGASVAQASAPHEVVRVRPGGEPIPVCTLDLLSYDLFLDPTGTRAIVTRNVGRRVDRVSIVDGTVSTLVVSGSGDDHELAVIRSAVWLDPDRAVLGESARGRAVRLWLWNHRDDSFTETTLPWPIHAVDLVPDGDSIFLNGFDAFAELSRDGFRARGYVELTRSAWSMDGRRGDVYLAAPAEDGARVLRSVGGAPPVEWARVDFRLTHVAVWERPS